MKLSHLFPNFYQAMSIYMIENNYNYSIPSDDSRKLSFMIPLDSHRKGFDYYEIDRLKNGYVFSVVTVLGLKTINQTRSKIVVVDLSLDNWLIIINDVVTNHFLSEEYLALKNGYIKTDKLKLPVKIVESNLKEKSNDNIFEENFHPLDSNLEYLRSKSRKDWSKAEIFLKNSDDFLKLSMELQNKSNNKGCLIFFLFFIFSYFFFFI
ncbi:hypothetical protein [Polaribacter sp.]|uniref:hypothetical protein n=1 Tax=Polaribacter sp. TaxID=1920175 RepID=UPI0040484136